MRLPLLRSPSDNKPPPPRTTEFGRPCAERGWIGGSTTWRHGASASRRPPRASCTARQRRIGGGAATRGRHGASASRRPPHGGSLASWKAGRRSSPPRLPLHLHIARSRRLLRTSGGGLKPVLILFIRISVEVLSNVCDVLNAGTLVTDLMGKNKSRKGKSKASKAPGRIAHHVVVPGELYQTLKEHMEKTPAGVVTDQPPGQSLVQPAPEPSHLLDTTRLLIFSMVDLLDDLVNTGICLLKLKVDHIAILSDGRRKLVDASFIERSSLPSLKDFKDKVHENYHDLAVIIDRDVLDQLSYCAPAEVKHMLSLMKSNPWGMWHLINLHSAMVPMENRSTLYTRLYNYIIDILRVTDPLGFEYVMANLEYNPDWQQEIVHNKYLLKYYNRPGYEPRPQGSVAITLEEHQQMLRFNRNGPAHPLQDAADPSAEDGMLYNQSGVSHMYHAHFARVIYSLQVALQAIDKLKFVETRSLFCNSLKKYEEIE